MNAYQTRTHGRCFSRWQFVRYGFWQQCFLWLHRAASWALSRKVRVLYESLHGRPYA